MENFTKISTVLTVSGESTDVQVVKYQKNGKKKIVYRAEVNGENVCKTLWARKYDARNVARKYIQMKEQ